MPPDGGGGYETPGRDWSCTSPAEAQQAHFLDALRRTLARESPHSPEAKHIPEQLARELVTAPA